MAARPSVASWNWSDGRSRSTVAESVTWSSLGAAAVERQALRAQIDVGLVLERGPLRFRRSTRATARRRSRTRGARRPARSSVEPSDSLHGGARRGRSIARRPPFDPRAPRRSSEDGKSGRTAFRLRAVARSAKSTASDSLRRVERGLHVAQLDRGVNERRGSPPDGRGRAERRGPGLRCAPERPPEASPSRPITRRRETGASTSTA